MLICHDNPSTYIVVLVVEAKLKNGTQEQYSKLDDAIRTGQFVRNSRIRYWLDNKGVTRLDLKLAKSISDASWYQFTQWVNYFAKIYGVTVIAVPPHFTTQDCSVCGTRVQKTLSTRTHSCPHCKVVLCRDKNAARNILARGLKMLAKYLKDTVGHTGIGCSDTSNAWGESDHWLVKVDINQLSRLVEPGISMGDQGRIPRYTS